MADLFCNFLHLRSPSTNYYNLPSNNTFSFSAHSFSSSFRKISRKPLLCKPAFSAVDVISTHEQSDGSLLFRFGDPSEIVKNVELEKPEEIENGGVDESGVVKELDGDDENEIMAEKVETEVNGSSLVEVLDESDLVDLEKSVIVDEEIGNEGVIESSAVEVLDSDRENEIVVDKVEREVNGSSSTEVPDEFDPVGLQNPMIVDEELKDKEVIESIAAEVLDGDRESEVMVKVAERDVNGSGLTELADEFDLVELETPVTVDEEIESDGTGQSSVGKVLDGDNESVAMSKEPEKDVNVSGLTELPDEFNLVGLVEGSNESSGSEEELPELDVALEVSSSAQPDIQNIGYDQDIEDSSLENVAVADEIREIENFTVTKEWSEKNIGNATTLLPVPFEPENDIPQSSTGITVTTDDLLVSEHQNVNAELHNGNITIEDSTSYYEVAENSTDISVDPVEAESQDEINENCIEIESSELLSNSSNFQVDMTLSEEAECETSQVSVQTVVVANECESYANDIAVESPQLEAEITDVEAQSSEMGNGIKNETVKDESDVSVSPQLEAESQNEISEDGRENGSSELLSNSPDPQVEVSLSEVAEGQISRVSIQSLSSSTQLEADINLSIDTETRTSETETGIANKIVTNESKSGVIEFTPMSPQLEAESQLDEEMGDGIVSKFKQDEVTGNDESDGDTLPLTPGSDSLEALQNDERVESPPMTNDVPQDLVLETERINGDDNLQLRQLPVVSGNEVVEPESTEYARNSEEIGTDFVLSSGAALLPHPTKVLTGGEDAYFVTGQTWLGVADGVLQWSLDGTSPGVYAQDLIINCEKLASDCKGNSISYPLDLLNSSVAETLSSGCSTVLLARVDGQVLHVANVGDSGFIILRHGTVYKRSLPMLHAFHLPLQIERDDDPSLLAELYQVDLEEDDVIVTATDGLFDNLYDQEISSIVFKSLAADFKLEEIAELLATKAQEVGGSTSSRSPFADSAQAAGYVGYTGGKLDDVTVIVSIVQRQSSL